MREIGGPRVKPFNFDEKMWFRDIPAQGKTARDLLLELSADPEVEEVKPVIKPFEDLLPLNRKQRRARDAQKRRGRG